MIFGQLADFISASGRRLNSLGVGRGDRVAVVLPNGPEMALAFLAVPSMTLRP
jgi:acyl-coenzyme A synthetase/AMP-(fatty) acid ligase